MRILLIDGDPIAYNAAHFARTAKDARAGAVRTLDKLVRDLSADAAIVFLSDPTRRYWRHKLWPDYKSGAKERPPLVLPALDELQRERDALWCRDLESDDLLGIYATRVEDAGVGERVVVGDDKDLLTIPGRHYRRRTGELVDVTTAEADWRHLQQTLIGDDSDGYPGCPGIGEKTAPKVVTVADVERSPAKAWAAVVATFVERGGTADDALLQARLARICRADDFDAATSTVRAWEPPAAMAGVQGSAAPPAPTPAPPPSVKFFDASRDADRFGLPDLGCLRTRCAKPIAAGQGSLF